MITLLNRDCFEVLEYMKPVQMIFADPPDNIGLKYSSYEDNMADGEYQDSIRDLVERSMDKCNVFWLSYNAKHTFMVSRIIDHFMATSAKWEARPFVQVFKFGQNRQTDFSNCHRPLVRLMKKGTELYPDAVREPSWRQIHGDKRADPKGKVPSDVTYSDTYSPDTVPIPNMSPKDVERFFEKLNIKGENDCWEWSGCYCKGYGKFSLEGHARIATRIMWRLYYGEDPCGQCLLHTCDNPSCCNPKHLFLGSIQDNNKDMAKKKRNKRGEQHWNSKLGKQEVAEIYMSADSGVFLAKKYEVSIATIHNIRNDASWTHVTADLKYTDVFNMPRVTGNSKQRRSWHPTQLKEELYERCIKSCCLPGDTVCDLFAGTGTLARVAERCKVNALMVEIDPTYCAHIASEHKLKWDGE